jgi:Cu(I)/Ag(I) efflux system periplasmic protein CusF
MNRLLTTLALAAACAAAPAFAQHAAHGTPAANAATKAAAEASFVDAEVRRVDAETGKLTLRHGEIRYLEMSPMTMVFTAKDKALLAGLKAGDRIRFKAAHEGDTYWITAIEGR